MGSKITQTTLRVPESFLEKLRKEAECKGVSVNELILLKLYFGDG